MGKKEYIKKWIKEHPQIRIYLKKEEYEMIKQIANEKKLSFKEIFLKGIEYLKGEACKEEYNEGYKKGYEAGYNIAFLDIRMFPEFVEERLSKVNLEFLRCFYCGKPFPGYIIGKDEPIGNAIKEFVIMRKLKHSQCPIL
jgi:hypothetical protein